MFETILAAIDLEHRDQGLEILSAAKSAADSDGSNIHLVTVVPSAPAIVSQFLQENYEQLAAKEARKQLTELAQDAHVSRDEANCLIRFGSVYEEVIAAADAVGADLLVIGSHKPDFSDYLLGSNAARVVRHCDRSVLVIR